MQGLFTTFSRALSLLPPTLWMSHLTTLQSIFAVERLVDKTIAKQLPKAPYVVSFILRLINNIWGGENFIDHARWTGIQPSLEESKGNS